MVFLWDAKYGKSCFFHDPQRVFKIRKGSQIRYYFIIIGVNMDEARQPACWRARWYIRYIKSK